MVTGKKTSYQVEEEGVQTSAKTHRGEDAQTDPVGAPQRLLLHVAHILQRPERGTVNHMAETHAQSVRKTRRGWEEGVHRGREGERDRLREGTRVKVCKTEGTLKGGRGQVSGREREGERPLERQRLLLSVEDRAVG